jgi:hypothetical protein
MLGFPGTEISPCRLADWIEASVLYEGRSLSLISIVDALLAESGIEEVFDYDEGYLPELDIEEPSESHETQMKLEALVNDAFDELLSRQEIVGSSYPLVIDHDLVRSSSTDWRDFPIYSFLLALNARYVYGIPANINVAARLFERLVVFALESYWNGSALHFGSPRDGEDPRQFRDALKLIAQKINERLLWDRDEMPSHTGDMTVDAVAWRPLDERRGHSVLLCQCSIGDEWETKKLDEGVWRHLIMFSVNPIKCLAFPFVAESLVEIDEFRWEMLCARVGIPLDRLRLSQLLASAEIPTELQDGFVTWTSTFLASLN